MVALCPDNMIGKRDRALLCLGFAGAFRRSELCALEVADLTEVPDGLCRRGESLSWEDMLLVYPHRAVPADLP
jgi:integrase